MKSTLVRTEWVMLPMWVQSHVRSHLREVNPSIKGLAYYWNHMQDENERFTLLKEAGID